MSIAPNGIMTHRVKLPAGVFQLLQLDDEGTVASYRITVEQRRSYIYVTGESTALVALRGALHAMSWRPEPGAVRTSRAGMRALDAILDP